MTDLSYFSAIAGHQKIDADKGIIYGVSVITEGEAKGHGIWIDQTSLSQLHSVASGFKDGIKVKLSSQEEHDGSVAAIIGTLKDFRVDGSQVRADLHLMKSHDSFGHVLELAEKQPDNFGLSIVTPTKIEKLNQKKFLRIEDIYSADLVEAPAANPTGLFSEKTSCTKKDDCECQMCMSKRKKKETKMNDILAKVLKLDANATEEQIVTALSAALTPKETDLTKLTSQIEAAQTKLTALTADAESAKVEAKKTEIAALVSEAARDGKVVPLDDTQLAAMPVETIKQMISKLPKTVAMTRKPVETAVKDGKRLRGAELIEFCQSRQEQGQTALTQKFIEAGLN